jgi:hypothetical protein
VTATGRMGPARGEPVPSSSSLPGPATATSRNRPAGGAVIRRVGALCPPGRNYRRRGLPSGWSRDAPLAERRPRTDICAGWGQPRSPCRARPRERTAPGALSCQPFAGVVPTNGSATVGPEGRPKRTPCGGFGGSAPRLAQTPSADPGRGQLAAQHRRRLGQRRAVPGEVPPADQRRTVARECLGAIGRGKPIRLVRQHD